jgi:hypothetical protein
MKQAKRSYHRVVTGALLAVALVFGFTAFAADQNPCSEDIAKFCKDVGPSWGAIMACLEQHESQLSDACKDYEAKMEKPRVESREAMRQQMRIRQACRDDVTKFCNDVKSASGGIATCLKEHAGELSLPCKDALEAAKGGEEERTAK